MATQAEIADHLDLSQPAVAEMIRRGIIEKAGRGDYDLDAARVAYIRHLRAEASGNDHALAAERTRVAKAQADRFEFENAQRRAEVIPRGEVIELIQTSNAHVRAKLLAIPTRAAPRVANLNKPAPIKKLLTEMIYEALEELASTKVVSAEGRGGGDGSGSPRGGDDDLGTAARSDGQRVGGSKPRPQSRGKRRAR